MNLTKLFDKQRKLDERIVREKKLEGRGFKFWSEDREPRINVNTCEWCNEKGMRSCCGCEGKSYKNPLLEEYVDCLHFILSIGLEKGFDKVYGIGYASPIQ